MELTNELLASYVGGQMEIQNQMEGYLYRGEIESIVVDDESLKATFSWLAKGEGYPPLPHKWVKSDTKDYSISLIICGVSDIGSGRICLYSPIVGEMVVLFPSGGSRLNPAKVEGL